LGAKKSETGVDERGGGRMMKERDRKKGISYYYVQRILITMY
jgi:hypothetical protein